jgi:serine phosphatase RsbU (regulator of sigma subunit)
MINISKSTKILVPVLGVLFVLPFIYDFFKLFSEINIVSLDYVAEILMLLLGVGIYRIVQTQFNISDRTIQDNLKLFVYLLGALYLVVIILQITLNPSFSPANFPPLPESISSVIYANLLSLCAMIFLIPMILVLKNLIYYKRTARTMFFMRAFLILSLACILTTVITGAELNLEFSGAGLYNNTLLIGVLLCVFILAFRNSWITYLPRREKITYFFITPFLVWAILYLFEFAFAIPVFAHSLAIGVFTNISWYLLITYTMFSGINLLLQLPTARVFDRKMEEVNSLHNLSRAISAEFNFNKLVKLITEMTTRVIGSDSTWLELYKEKSKHLYIASSHNINENEIQTFQKSGRQDLSEEILTNKRPILINEITRNHPFNYIKTWKSDINSIIGVPLISGNGKSLGLLFATKRTSFGFNPDDQAMLEAYANQAVIALDNAALLKQSFERERLEEELRIARDVQRRLLPQSIPEYDNVSIEALTITAYEVGGDYYDFINLPDNQLGFIIGDVSGKGTSAAFYMAEAKGIIQSLSKTFHKPRDLLIRTNEILYESLEKKTFISMLMASLDCKKRIFSFARAGHCPLLYYNSRQKSAELLQPQGIGVGLEGGDVFQETLAEQTLKCNEGDIFVFYTDGLSEARNHEGDEFGDDRLVEIINLSANKSVAEIKEIIIDSILTFLNGKNLADDLTLLLVKT